MKTRTIMVTFAWSLVISSIILQVLYVTPDISWPHYVLFALASTLCGVMIVDLGDLILSYFVVLPMSFFLTTFFLGILPSITGKLQTRFLASDLLVSYALTMIIKSTFPSVWVICLLAGILGSGIGEWIEPIPEKIETATDAA